MTHFVKKAALALGLGAAALATAAPAQAQRYHGGYHGYHGGYYHGYHHGNTAALVGTEPLCEDRSRAAGPDDQYIVVH